MALDSFQRRLNSERAHQTENLSSQVDNDENASEQSENGYWLLEENSNSDSNQEDQNPSSSSRTRSGWTSRWIQLDPMNRDSDYELFPTDQSGRRNSNDRIDASTLEPRTQASSTDRNQLSPISINSTRYEQPPLFPFRSLRENQERRMESNQEAAASSAQAEGRTDASRERGEARATTSQNNEDGSKESELRNPRRQPQSTLKKGFNSGEGRRSREERNRRMRASSLPQGQGLSDNIGVRQGIQLLSRYIDNMQRLCR